MRPHAKQVAPRASLNKEEKPAADEAAPAAADKDGNHEPEDMVTD